MCLDYNCMYDLQSDSWVPAHLWKQTNDEVGSDSKVPVCARANTHTPHVHRPQRVCVHTGTYITSHLYTCVLTGMDKIPNHPVSVSIFCTYTMSNCFESICYIILIDRKFCNDDLLHSVLLFFWTKSIVTVLNWNQDFEGRLGLSASRGPNTVRFIACKREHSQLLKYRAFILTYWTMDLVPKNNNFESFQLLPTMELHFIGTLFFCTMKTGLVPHRLQRL
jgi:hypothetical protein